MSDAGIATITVGVDYETSLKAVNLANQNKNLYACVGMHPNDSVETFFEYEKYLDLARNEKVVAIGETGLDYFRDQSVENKNHQKEIFIKHIELAIELDKPLMIHARPSVGTMDAYEDVLDILESYKLKAGNYNLTANFHFFVGNIDIANRIVKNNWTMSFDGPITFSRDYDEVIKNIPLQNIMAETDAPFASPAPYRGKTCEPWMVVHIYEQIAQIRGQDADDVRKQINQNVYNFFGIL